MFKYLENRRLQNKSAFKRLIFYMKTFYQLGLVGIVSRLKARTSECLKK